MKRRKFLTTGTAAAAALLLPSCSKRRVATQIGANTNSTATLVPEDRTAPCTTIARARRVIVDAPPAGKYYHGVYPGGPSGNEDDLKESDLSSYESKETGVGRKAAWVYFSHNWYMDGRTPDFPKRTAEWISRDDNRVPFIRLMLRQTTMKNELDIDYDRCRVKAEKNQDRNNYLQFILTDGKVQDDLKRWGEAAGKFKKPLIVEWGTEVNGYWFPWNGWWNGKALGPGLFKEAYCRIVNSISEGGADNITWVFHFAASDDPDPDPEDECTEKIGYSWNRFENYYPGPGVVDWLGVSVYGAQEPKAKECLPFKSQMKRVYDRLQALAPEKPVFVLEMGATMNARKCGKQPDDRSCRKLGGAAKWADEALNEIRTNAEWRERLHGFSWWNEQWDNDKEGKPGQPDPDNHTNMRVEDVPCLREVFRHHLVTEDAKKSWIVDTPLIRVAAP